MSLPLPQITWYRLPDVTVSTGTIVGLLDALWTAVGQTVDWVGTSLPSTHLWTWSRYQAAGPTTEAIYASAPSGTPMTQTPRIILAGRVTIGTPTMITDTAVASNLMISMNLRGGAFATWDSASPFTSGVFPGFARCAATAANAVGTLVRCYVSEEGWFFNVIQSNTVQYWSFAGALCEPYTNDTTSDAELDNRLYVFATSGGGAACALALNTQAGTADPFAHSVTPGNGHGYTFVPGTGINGNGCVYTSESMNCYRRAATATHYTTLSGAILSSEILWSRITGGEPLGRLREIYYLGSRQGGLTYSNGTDHKLHCIGKNNGAASDAISLLSD